MTQQIPLYESPSSPAPMERPLDVVVAIDAASWGIGAGGSLPWPRLRDDVRLFQRLTTGRGLNAVIMGHGTWQSLPAKHRPLANRFNVVLSRRHAEPSPTIHDSDVNGNDQDPGSSQRVIWCCSLEQAFQWCDQRPWLERIFVIGGGQVYREACQHPRCRFLYLTRILSPAHPHCDVHFPAPLPTTSSASRAGGDQAPVEGGHRDGSSILPPADDDLVSTSKQLSWLGPFKVQLQEELQSLLGDPGLYRQQDGIEYEFTLYCRPSWVSSLPVE